MAAKISFQSNLEFTGYASRHNLVEVILCLEEFLVIFIIIHTVLLLILERDVF